MIPGQEQSHVPSLNLNSIRDCGQGDETIALPLEVVLANNLWVIICGLLVFIMTVSVGFLEVGELGADMDISLLKTMLITGSGIFFMAFVCFKTAFGPTINRIIWKPVSKGLFLFGFFSVSY